MIKSLNLALFVLAFSSAQVHAVDETDPKFIRYGDQVYVQDFFMDSRWLRGSGGEKNEVVVTRSQLKDDYERQHLELYQWKLQSTQGANAQSLNDPKNGNCIKYGDVFYFHQPSSNMWMSGGRSDGNEGVVTRHYWDDSYEQSLNAYYQWKVLSKAGTGTRGVDPATGTCIEDLSLVFFENMGMDGRWLSGARGSGNELVITRNMFGSDYEYDTVLSTYQWIVRKDEGTGSTGGALRCAAVPDASIGRWVPVKYSNGDQTVTYQEGTTRTQTEGITTTSSWQTSIQESITAGFSFAGMNAGTSLTVSSQYSHSQQQSVSNAVSQTETQTFSTSFGPGQVWQFQYQTKDICYSDAWDIMTTDLVLTPNRDNEPCCLPGYARDNDNQHGPCLDNSPCLCGDAICNKTRFLRG